MLVNTRNAEARRTQLARLGRKVKRGMTSAQVEVGRELVHTCVAMDYVPSLRELSTEGGDWYIEPRDLPLRVRSYVRSVAVFMVEVERAEMRVQAQVVTPEPTPTPDQPAEGEMAQFLASAAQV